MKKETGQRNIVFFTSEDNSRAKTKTKSRRSDRPMRTTVSATGRLAFSAGVIEAMGVEPTSSFRIGKENTRGGIKTLFLLPAEAGASDAFSLTKTGSTYGLNLGGIFRNQKVDYKTIKYTFSIEPYQTPDGSEGFELELIDRVPRSKRERGASDE